MKQMIFRNFSGNYEGIVSNLKMIRKTIEQKKKPPAMQGASISQ